MNGFHPAAGVSVRAVEAADHAAIATVVDTAFAAAAHADGTEAALVAELRAAGGIACEWVAVEGTAPVGHIAFSAVTLDGRDCNWFGLAPLAVAPAHQGRGIGSRLVRTGLAALQARGAGGCVVLGEPAYYGRFGFAALPMLVCAWPVPPQYFQALAWQPLACAGIVRYHPLFGAV